MNNTTPNNSNITQNILAYNIRFFHGNILHAVNLVDREKNSNPAVTGIVKPFENKITRRSTINYIKLSIFKNVTFSVLLDELL